MYRAFLLLTLRAPLAEIQSQEGGSYEEHISARWTNVTTAVQTAEWAETPSRVWCGEVSQGAAGGGGLRGGPAPALPHPGGWSRGEQLARSRCGGCSQPFLTDSGGRRASGYSSVRQSCAVPKSNPEPEWVTPRPVGVPPAPQHGPVSVLAALRRRRDPTGRVRGRRTTTGLGERLGHLQEEDLGTGTVKRREEKNPSSRRKRLTG